MNNLIVIAALSTLIALQFSTSASELLSALADQNLSHFAFHSRASRHFLLNLTRHYHSRSRSVAIVGVEYGEDVFQLREKYHVYAIEALPIFANHLRRVVKRENSDVEIIQGAAGPTSNVSVDVEYQGKVESVTSLRLDSVIQEELLLLSVDVQGNEAQVLKGATGLFEKGMLMLWVEIIACNEGSLEVLRMLEKDYICFDFVLWGMGNDGKEAFWKWEGERSVEEYWKGVCEVKQSRFRWLQTDVVALKRAGMKEELLREVGNMGNVVCKEQNCRYRKEMEIDGDHDEL